ncbi:Teneurin-2 [Bagarius yarrelli]|uniref:Teneurin-2 n=1 Tax=Bagarius yarrelli TaxID=175774 RepID=A0A556TXB7_BAGYA|nr:Teneurin-2 [Bagarius yarrelli]
MCHIKHAKMTQMARGSLTLAQLGVCDSQQQQSVYCSDLGLMQQGYSLSAGYDADSDPEGLMTPESAVQLWRGQGLKSHHSSGLSSPDQSALTLTDSENEHKTDDEAVSDCTEDESWWLQCGLETQTLVKSDDDETGKNNESCFGLSEEMHSTVAQSRSFLNHQFGRT